MTDRRSGLRVGTVALGIALLAVSACGSAPGTTGSPRFSGTFNESAFRSTYLDCAKDPSLIACEASAARVEKLVGECRSGTAPSPGECANADAMLAIVTRELANLKAVPRAPTPSVGTRSIETLRALSENCRVVSRDHQSYSRCLDSRDVTQDELALLRADPLSGSKTTPGSSSTAPGAATTTGQAASNSAAVDEAEEAGSLKLAEAKCTAGDQDGCLQVAARSRESDPLRSYQLAQKACERKNMRGCAFLGALHLGGIVGEHLRPRKSELAG